MASKDPEARRAYQREFYTTYAQRKRRREYQQEVRRDPRRAASAEKLRAAVRRYRRRLRWQVFEKDQGRCHYCHVEITYETFWMDHKHPRRFNGPTVLINLVAACQPCNRKKGLKSYDTFMALMNPDTYTPRWVETNGDEPPEAGQLGD